VGPLGEKRRPSVGKKRHWVRTCGLVSRRVVYCVGNHFSREQWPYSTLSTTHEWLLYMDHVRYVWSYTIHRLSMESVWCVGQVFPCRCTSIQIAVTLEYEYRLFVAVIT
jgi:hypothetical protein